MALKKTTTLAKQSFVTVEVLTEKFRYANARVPILDKASLELKVESDEQLTIAQNNASEVLALYKEVDSMRKLLKAPHADTVQTIDGYCNIILESLNRIKLRFTSQITDFKVIKEAQLKAERDAKLKELEALENEKKEESAKIVRIETQLIAKIYGGTYHTKSGEAKTSIGCVKDSDCDELLTFINTSAPDPRSFKYFQGTYEDMLISVKKKLTEHRVNLIDLHKDDQPIAKEGAMRRINESRMDAAQDIVETAQTTEKVIAKEIKSETKAIDREVEDAGKGVRETLTYEVIDELLVPRDMLTVDSRKVNSYIDANKDKIRESLIKNEEVVPGIRFLVTNKFVTR
jgi:hypothetical protein